MDPEQVVHCLAGCDQCRSSLNLLKKLCLEKIRSQFRMVPSAVPAGSGAGQQGVWRCSVLQCQQNHLHSCQVMMAALTEIPPSLAQRWLWFLMPRNFANLFCVTWMEIGILLVFCFILFCDWSFHYPSLVYSLESSYILMKLCKGDVLPRGKWKEKTTSNLPEITLRPFVVIFL